MTFCVSGGFSSLLALSLLVTSQSHIFISFFKIFFMICIFGLYHGLVLLPVVLCIVGPIDAEDARVSQARTKTKPYQAPWWFNGNILRQNKILYCTMNLIFQEARKKALLLANANISQTQSNGSDVRYKIENRLNLETEVRESLVPGEGEVTETVIA